LKDVIVSFGDEAQLREWLVKNVKGIGFKEASHFLRNIGYSNLAILDFHIINVLVKHRLVEKPKTLTKKHYLEIEMLLRDIAEKASLTLAELDLFLWYMETGKILK
jgi:N-glycosylase/DNA lyase